MGYIGTVLTCSKAGREQNKGTHGPARSVSKSTIRYRLRRSVVFLCQSDKSSPIRFIHKVFSVIVIPVFSRPKTCIEARDVSTRKRPEPRFQRLRGEKGKFEV